MRRIDIENAILNTFLDANDVADDLSNIYELDASIFTSPFRKRVAERINTVDDNAYGFECVQIEESVKGTSFEQDFTDMASQSSLGLGFSKKYHDKLVEETRLDGLV